MKALTFLEFYKLEDQTQYMLDCGFFSKEFVEDKTNKGFYPGENMDNYWAVPEYRDKVSEPMNEKMLFKFDYDESILKRVDFYEEDNKVCLSTSDKVVSAVCLIVDDYIRLFKINNLSLEWKNEKD